MDFLKFAVIYCTQFGFNIIRIARKKPYNEKISLWFEKNRTIDDLKKLDWTSALITGIAVIIRKELIVFDFDKVKDISIVHLFLEEIGLAKSYKWIVKSGSGAGYHVFVFVKNKEELLKNFGNKDIVYFYPKNKITLHHLEVRIRNCYVVLSPSIHPDTNNEYVYLNGFPDDKPAYVDENKLIEFLNKYFDYKPKKLPQDQQKERSTKEFNKSTKHLNEAIDYIKEKYFDYPGLEQTLFCFGKFRREGERIFFQIEQQ